MLKKLLLQRLKEFEKLGKERKVVFDFKPFLNLKLKANWKTEFAFCIAAANSSAFSALKFQKKLESLKLEELGLKELKKLLKESGVRFFNKKAVYLKEGIKKFDQIEKILRLEEKECRERLVKQVKGFGYKEASHFLRNLGRKQVAILDRHILNWLKEKNYLKTIPSTLSKSFYLELEELLERIAENKKVSLAELDLHLWYKKTGKILK